MNHTKGKWKASSIFILAEGKTGGIGQSFVQEIPRHENKFAVDIEGLANAKLMAASPTMLNAIEKTTQKLTKAIHATPTGAVRDLLTEINILLLSAADEATD